MLLNGKEGKAIYMSIFLSILLSLIVLGILITIHELGHYTAGRILGFGIREFAIGMGPKLFKKEKNGILYTIRLLPIGGMCSFYGEDEEIKDSRSFNAFKVWKRAIVIAAGPVMNFLLAIVLAFVMLLAFGAAENVEMENPIIMSFEENSPAQASGLFAGDMVLSVNGTPVATSEEMIQTIRASENDSVTLEILRQNENTTYTMNGTPVTDAEDIEEYVNEHNDDRFVLSVENGDIHEITITGIYDESVGYNRIGAGISMYYGSIPVSYNVGEAFLGTFDYIGSLLKEMFKFIGSLFTGGVSINDMAGIVGIVDIVNDGVDTIISSDIGGGEMTLNILQYILALAIMLSVNLGFINLFPFPALDGGRLVFLGIEAIFKKPVPVNVEAIINFIGLILLLGLIVVISINDVMRAFGG